MAQLDPCPPGVSPSAAGDTHRRLKQKVAVRLQQHAQGPQPAGHGKEEGSREEVVPNRSPGQSNRQGVLGRVKQVAVGGADWQFGRATHCVGPEGLGWDSKLHGIRLEK